MPKKTGFTLIELLVVIAIIALLLSILMPSLNSVKERGRRVVCLNNVRQLSMANITYAQLYNGRFVPMEVGGEWKDKAADSGGYDIRKPDGTIEPAPYLMWMVNNSFLKQLDQTSTDNAGYSLSSNPFDYYGLPKKFRCPSYPSKKASVSGIINTDVIIQLSYSPNITDSMRAESGMADVMFEEIWDKGVVVDQIKRPSSKLLFTDGNNPVITYAKYFDDYQGNYVNHWDEHGEIFDWEMDSLDLSGYHGAEPMYRHSEGAAVAFCDGHAEYLKKTEMFYFTDGNKPNAAATNVDLVRNDRLWCYFK